jgi:hypothetical protein
MWSARNVDRTALLTYRLGSTTRCLTRDLGEKQAEVRCFSDQGRPIECCGHGLLCSAAFWRARWGCDGVLVNGATHISFSSGGRAHLAAISLS